MSADAESGVEEFDTMPTWARSQRIRMGATARRAFLWLLLGLTPWITVDAQEQSEGSHSEIQDDSLRTHLEALSNKGLLYTQVVLRFTCQETIRYKIYSAHAKTVIEDDRAKFDYILLERKPDANTHDLTSSPLRELRRSTTDQRFGRTRFGNGYLALESPLTWVFMFAREKWPYFSYTLDRLGLEGSPPSHAWIRLAPKEPRVDGVRYWYASALIDTRDYSILRVEAESPADRELLAELERTMNEEPQTLPDDPKSRVVFTTRFVTNFAVEKEGLRFPSDSQVITLRHSIPNLASPLRIRSQDWGFVTQRYRKYKIAFVESYSE